MVQCHRRLGDTPSQKFTPTERKDAIMNARTNTNNNRKLDNSGFKTRITPVPEDMQVLHNYGYKPDPIFFPRTGLNHYFGVEVEYEAARGDYSALQSTIPTVYGHLKNRVYLKSDGSLTCGAEIVTHPCTLKEHKRADWTGLLQTLSAMGMQSHDGNRAGIHVHINKTGLGYNDAEVERTIARLLYLVNDKFYPQLYKFSRRTDWHWCKQYVGLHLEDADVTDAKLLQKLAQARRDNGANRYRCLNFQNNNTVEVRIFRGTLNVDTFYAILELCDALLKFAKTHSIEYLASCTWAQFTQIAGYDTLKTYIARNNIA